MNVLKLNCYNFSLISLNILSKHEELSLYISTVKPNEGKSEHFYFVLSVFTTLWETEGSLSDCTLTLTSFGKAELFQTRFFQTCSCEKFMF